MEFQLIYKKYKIGIILLILLLSLLGISWAAMPDILNFISPSYLDRVHPGCSSTLGLV